VFALIAVVPGATPSAQSASPAQKIDAEYTALIKQQHIDALERFERGEVTDAQSDNTSRRAAGVPAAGMTLLMGGQACR
jgi:hypothetical protein